MRYITEEAAYGWFIRGVHKWGATLMIAAVILHQMRVFFTGASREPREINWMVGMCLLLCTLVLGFTGYRLVFEQLSCWGATVGANIAASVPVVGEPMKQILLGGETYNEHTLPRFFVQHGAVLPVLLVLLLVIHIAIIRIQGVTEFPFEGDSEETARGHFNFVPDHLMTELTLGLVLMVLLSVLATALPAHLGPPADPLSTPEVIKPEWFFYVAFRWLKLFSGTVAVLSTGFVVFVMFVWPFIDAWIRRHTRFSEASAWISMFGVLAIVALTIREAAVEH
ncbi:MAG: cytochrome bc complex cytochrome b subunit [Deltaproteobacteria bacterium]|nr:cytochrome bc complex cytochrome b subunit [Deltaproteobacteria bacterium]